MARASARSGNWNSAATTGPAGRDQVRVQPLWNPWSPRARASAAGSGSQPPAASPAAANPWSAEFRPSMPPTPRSPSSSHNGGAPAATVVPAAGRWWPPGPARAGRRRPVQRVEGDRQRRRGGDHPEQGQPPHGPPPPGRPAGDGVAAARSGPHP